jgi:hypothetical protein
MKLRVLHYCKRKGSGADMEKLDQLATMLKFPFSGQINAGLCSNKLSQHGLFTAHYIEII